MELAIINGTYRNGQGQPVGLQTATGQPNPSSLGALNLAAIAAAAGQKPAAYYLDPRTAALLGSAQNPLAALSTTTTHSMVAAAAPSGVFSAGIRQSPNLTGAQLMMQSPISSAAGTKTTAAQQQQAAMAAAASAQQQQHNAAAALVMAQQQAQAQQQLAALQQLAAANQYAGATNQSTALDYQLLLRLDLVNTSSLHLFTPPHIQFHATATDGSYRTGGTGSAGSCLPATPPGNYGHPAGERSEQCRPPGRLRCPGGCRIGCNWSVTVVVSCELLLVSPSSGI